MSILSRIMKSRRRKDYKLGQNAFARIRRLFVMLLAVLVLHALAMVLFEKMSWAQGLWLSITTATTVGYGDTSAATPFGQLATVILMYVIGISLLAQLASEYFEFRLETRTRQIKGLWNWKDMREHILIINTPEHSGERYLMRLIGQISNTPVLSDHPIQLITTHFPDGLPQKLQDMGVVHTHGHAVSESVLRDANVEHAKYIFIIAREEGEVESDSVTLDILERIRREGSKAHVVVETVDDKNRERFKHFGANSTLRPIRAYPELVARAMAAPGSEEVLENLFNHEGCFAQRIDVKVELPSWRELVEKIIPLDVGMPLGYIDKDNRVITNPSMSEMVSMASLLLLTNDLSQAEDAVIPVLTQTA